MVDRNNQFNDDNIQMRNKTGFLFPFQLEKPVTDYFFIRGGIGYVQKQVNPMENSYSIFWDKLKTGYLSIPVLAGMHLLPSDQRLNLAVSMAPLNNYSKKIYPA